MRNKIIVCVIVFMFSLSLLGFQVSSGFEYQNDLETQVIFSNDTPYFENVVLITWDGTNARALEELIDDGTLVNTKKIDEIFISFSNPKLFFNPNETNFLLCCIFLIHF